MMAIAQMAAHGGLNKRITGWNHDSTFENVPGEPQLLQTGDQQRQLPFLRGSQCPADSLQSFTDHRAGEACPAISCSRAMAVSRRSMVATVPRQVGDVHGATVSGEAGRDGQRWAEHQAVKSRHPLQG